MCAHVNEEGYCETLEKLPSHCFWPSTENDATEMVWYYLICAIYKTGRLVSRTLNDTVDGTRVNAIVHVILSFRVGVE